MIDYVCEMILNTLACQLESLHLSSGDLKNDWLNNWQFICNNYPCTRDNQQFMVSKKC